MFLRALQRRPFIASVAVLTLAVAAATAEAADITSANPRIENGRLVITGTTTTSGIKVRLDGQTGSAFNVASSSNRTFVFNLVYLPSDCIVTLQKVSGTTLGAPSDWVVANCGTGLSPRGPWSSAVPYLTNDLVTH